MLNELWGSVVVSFVYDITARRAVLEARVLENGRKQSLVLSLVGVERLDIQRPDTNAWDYAEITEAHAHAAGEATELSLLFWDEPNRLSARCDSWTLEQKRSVT